MIYVSSTCIEAETIKDSVTILAEAGLKNIELSGGTNYYAEYERDLLRLQDKYELNYLVHNYFPPPEKPFVLNLASMNADVREQSILLCKKAIRLSKKLSGKRYGVHAGFLIDIDPWEAGKNIGHRRLSDRNEALNIFVDAWKLITEEADGVVTLYVENNVYSSTNATTYSGSNPFLLTDYRDYQELNNRMDINLLLDVAHLKVSSNSLGLDFDDELEKLFAVSDYIHLSDNDGSHDQNKIITNNSDILKKLDGHSVIKKNITLEVCDELEKILSSFRVVKTLLI